LMVSDGKDVRVGTPYLDGVKVIASFKTTAEEAVIKGQKLHPMYFRRRKNSRKRIGHRQKYLQVVIDKIEA
jgi:large subunit ribosomal protein L21